MPDQREKWKLFGAMADWRHATMNAGEAREACYRLFKMVDHTPYAYVEENVFFNMRFTPDSRRELFRLRKHLTVQLMENRPWDDVASTFSDISTVMGFAPVRPGPALREELKVPPMPG